MKKRIQLLTICILTIGLTLGCALLTPIQNFLKIQPDPTATPTAIPGWKRFEGKGVELWLPERFEGGNLDEDLDLITERLRNLGPDYEKMSEAILQNKSAFLLWTLDSVIGDSGFLAGMTITSEKVMSTVDIDEYLDASIQQFPAQFELVERYLVSLGDGQAGRLVLKFTLPEVTVMEVLYIVKADSTMYILTYSSSESEFDEKLPIFEQSAQTFKIIP